MSVEPTAGSAESDVRPVTQTRPTGTVDMAPPARSRGRSSWDETARWAGRRARILAPLLTLLGMVIFFSVATDSFLTPRNIWIGILGQYSAVAVAAAGTTFVLLCAEIDLSLAAVAQFIGIVVAYLWVTPWLGVEFGQWGIAIGLLASIAIGLFNGFLAAYVRIPSFMMTLAASTIALGLAVYVTKGKPIFQVPELLTTLGGTGTKVGPVPVVAIVAAVVLVIAEVILSYTKFGRYVYMTGGNREAAEMSGVNTRQVVALCLTISALTAGMAGMLNVGRLNTANPQPSNELLIFTIASVVLGGTSLFGGEGGIKNTVLGVLIFGVLRNGLNQVDGISIYIKQAVEGFFLVGALLLNVLALRLERVRTQVE